MQALGLPAKLLEEAVRAVLSLEQVTEAEFSVTLLGDAEVREMNRRWLGQDRVTDVIAFALHPPGQPPIGDVYIGRDQALRQARQWKVPAEEEFVRLVVHGTLHVLGHDHPEGDLGDREGSEMYRRQEAIVRTLLPHRDPTDGAASGRSGPYS